jgi:hypothetical protein
VDVTYEGPERWTATLRPSGAGRWMQLAFLSFWLCGWALGEITVIVILAMSLLGLGEAVDDPPALVLLFLLFWLAGWTFGGISALRAALALVWASDRIDVHPDGLHVVRRVGPFVSEVRVARADLLGVEARPGRLVACTTARDVDLTELGTADDQQRLLRDLKFTLGLDGAGATSLPGS